MQIKWGIAMYLLMEVMVISMIVFFWATMTIPDVRQLSYWTHLGSEGVQSAGFVLEKGVADTLIVPTDGCLVCGLWVKVEFMGPDGATIQRVFGVSRGDYHGYEPGERLQVAWLPDTPERYEIWGSFKENEYRKSAARGGLVADIFPMSVLSLMSIFLAVILYLVYRSGRRRKVSFKEKLTKCPQCGLPVQEGYVTPNIRFDSKERRMRWRASGPPGYRWYEMWMPREFPSYHCPNCETILVKY